VGTLDLCMLKCQVGYTYTWMGLCLDGGLPRYSSIVDAVQGSWLEDIGDYVCLVGYLHMRMGVRIAHVPCMYGDTLCGTNVWSSVLLLGI